MIKKLLLSIILLVSSLQLFAYTFKDGDIISIWYVNSSVTYFLGVNDYGTAISSSVSLVSENFLWVVEESSSQFYFKNLGTDKYLAVTISGTTPKLTMSDSKTTRFTYSSTGRLSYKYKTKTYYIRYSGGYTMGTASTGSNLNYNNFVLETDNDISFNKPTDIEWGYGERGAKSTFFSITVTNTLTYQGQDKKSQYVVSSSSTTVSDPEILRTTYGIDYEYESISKDNAAIVQSITPSSTTQNWEIKARINMSSSEIIKEWDGEPKENYSDSVKIIIKANDVRIDSNTIVLRVLRFFKEPVDEMKLEVVPGSYTFAATEASASSDYGWTQQFFIKRKIFSGSIIRYADGTEYTDKTEIKEYYLPDDILKYEVNTWVDGDGVIHTDRYKACGYEPSLYKNELGETPYTMAACSTDIYVDEGYKPEDARFQETSEDDRQDNYFFVRPTGNNTSGAPYSGIIHIRHQLQLNIDNEVKRYPNTPYPAAPELEYPAWVGEPNPADYTDGTSDPAYIEALEKYNKYVADTAAFYAAWRAYREIIEGDDYYVNAYIDISQLNTASMLEDRYVSQRGASGREMQLSGSKYIQSVHEAKSTIYCIPGEKDGSRLKLRGTSFFGWMRWFDYENSYSLTTKYGNSQWLTKPTATASGKSYDFVNIGNEFSLLSRGQYYAYGHSPFPSASPSYNVPVVQTPSQTVLDSYEAAGKPLLPMDVACDVSNYTDFSFTTSGGAQVIEGPTLSYRQIFQLRHADEMVAKMNSVKVSDRTGTDADPHYDDEGKSYLEEHVCIAPAGRYISLPTDYKYQYYTHLSELGYIYKEGSSYYRVGNGGSEVAQWYKNGAKAMLSSGESGDDKTYVGYVNSTTCFLVLNPHVMPTGKTIDTVVYTLATKNYNIARYIVVYQPISVVGPIAESGSPATAIITDYDIENRYEVLARCTFDPPINGDGKTKPNGNGEVYTAPGTTDIRTYNIPLAWDECSYGFAYSRPNITASKTARNTASADTDFGEKNQRSGGGTGAGIFPYWGEYMFINKLVPDLNGGYIIGTIEQRGGAANGYMLYCDGTEEPGLVVSLKVTSKLCAGQKMFCSAWINNVTKNFSSKAELPKFRFVVEGKMANATTWNAVTEYLSGDLEWKSGWCQVVFPIDLKYEYDEYQISIYNFANTSNGNDFAIDDIRIYATPLAISAYQTATSCSPSDGFSGLDVKATARIDYLGLMDDSFFDHDIFYQVFDRTLNKSLNAGYLGGKSTYGKFHIPVKGYKHKVSDPTNCYNSLEEFINAHDDDPSKKYGYVWEHIKDEERYVLYLAADIDPDATPAWKSTDDVVIFMATTPSDFGYSDCSMSAALPIQDKLFVYINDAPIAPTYCPNLKYKLEMHVYDYDVENASIVNAEGRCLNDWLIISSDFSYTEDQRIGKVKTMVDGKSVDLFAYEHYGYTYKKVVQAILDLRREPTPEVENRNALATSITEIYPEDFLDPNSWTIISTLIENGMLIIGQQYINAYLPESGLDFMVFPIEGTAFNKDNPSQSMNICFSPQRVVMNTWESQLKFHIGKKPYDEWNLEERINPYKHRVSKVRFTDPDMKIELPLHDYKYVDIVKVELEESNDGEFNPATHWYGLSSDIRYPEVYDEDGDIIKLTKVTTPPAGKTRYNKFRAGKRYTFCITWQDRGDTRRIHLPSTETEPQHTGVLNCDPGFSYVTVCIVPDTMVWTPAPNIKDSWFKDENWQAADKTTGAPIGPGFIPLPETHVIIANNWEERYPSIDPKSAEDEPTAYEILVRDSAVILGQELLTYTKAFVDMPVPSARWTIISPALNGVYSGDMYIPSAADTKLFEPKELDDNRSAYPFWQSLYDRTTEQEQLNESQNFYVWDSQWGPFVNTLGAEYYTGTGYAILGFDETDEEDHRLIIRLPKQENRYYYFYNGTVVPSRYVDLERPDNYGRFAYDPTQPVVIDNENPGRLFVFGNPTLAYIDMRKFLQTNTKLKANFYYMDKGSIGVYSTIAGTTSQRFLPPHRGVIVELKGTEPEAITLQLTLNSTMLAKTIDNPDKILHAPQYRENSNNVIKLLNITATNGSNQSTAVLGETSFSSNEYDDDDAKLLTSGVHAFRGDVLTTSINLFTICQNEALSIDLRKDFVTVPLGLIFPDPNDRQETTTLNFSFNEEWNDTLFLYDKKTDSYTEILNGLELEIETPNNDELRYYIVKHEKEDVITSTHHNQGTEQQTEPTIDFITLQKGQLTIVGSEKVDQLSIYDLTGRLIRQQNIGDAIATIHLPQGVYIATAQMGNIAKTQNIIIK